ncbi:MAG: dihydroneopterin aldolase [Verrucomicrobiota bacterium]
MDRIHIEALELSTRIGVPEEERATPQRLTVNLTLEPLRDFSGLADRIENTVNYFEVARAVQALARARPRQLIETLAGEIATFLLNGFALRAVEIELRKYILPDTAYVAVRMRREK